MTLRQFHIFILISACAIAILSACTAKKERPSDIFSHNEMVKALSDVYIAEQMTNRLGVRPDSAKKVLYKLKAGIFKKKGVSDSAFSKSFDYYIERPTELEEIYMALVDSLTLKEQLLNATPP